MSHRRERVADQLREELATLLRTAVRDPRMGFVTVTGVRMSADLRNARVYVSVLGDDTARSESLAALNAARGYLKREIGHALRLRYVPDLKFLHDASLEQGRRIEELLSGLPPSEDTGEDEE